MKVITVLQPWAWRIIHAGKDVENRTWRTNYRGPLLIHAGKSRRLIENGDLREYTLGAIIGVVDLVDCVPLAAVSENSWAEGPWCWILKNAQACDPIYLPGERTLWDLAIERIPPTSPIHERCLREHRRLLEAAQSSLFPEE